MLRSCVRAYSTTVASPFRLAVVGSGPAGFYTSHRLLKEHPNTQIDMFDSLPVPHGLVRFGVAPDHPEVKNVMSTFDRVAEDDRFRFLGNVTVGDSVTGVSVQELQQHYDAILFSYGASQDRQLGIPNEDVYGVDSARAFVAWYNGLPNFDSIQFPLDSTDTAVVIGQGNVALDVARVLLSPIDELRKTDITEYALEALSKSKIRHVHVVGRRGPLQASFTSKELREQMNLPGVVFHADHEWIKNEVAEAQPVISKNRPLKRLMSILEKGSATKQGDRSWSLKFLRSPVEILSQDNQVDGIRYEMNRLEGPFDQRKAIGTDTFEDQSCGLVLRSIGYRSIPMPGIPFNERQGRVPNYLGKVLTIDNQEVPGMYTAGWLKRGPTGVIVSTMNDAYETADTIAYDLKQGKPMLENSHSDGADGLVELFKHRNIRPVSYAEWKIIEQAEFDAGHKLGKPREKYAKIADMLALLN
ncbi:nucleotide-binding domain-containing protein [Lichtheimia hyalospora FSU 10163]|nr:nucleotide-binding domain-containing protein [Lichtheimia hyalospora FSU 10163]